MNENLDLTKILKDCPKGVKFYSSIHGNVKFGGIRDNRIMFVYTDNVGINNTSCVLSSGLWLHSLDGECILFPSKDQRDWSKWQRPFVDGDIIYNKFQNTIGIMIYSKNNFPCKICDISKKGVLWYNEGNLIPININDYKLATEEEKQMLFDTIEESGYKWDSNKKELIKLESKFDISTLQPFDRVLVRINDDNEWHISLFSHMSDSTCYRFVTVVGISCRQIVPYNEETKHLLGTTHKAPEKYINW